MNNEITTYLQSKSVQSTLEGKGLSKVDGSNYAASALRMIASNPNLVKCSPKSILDCLALAAELKLSPEASLDYIYFIPYGSTCKPMLGARGMKALLLREPSVVTLAIEVVEQGDEFVYEQSNEGGITYKYKPKAFPSGDPSLMIGVIAYLEIQTPQKGKRQHLVRMSKAEIDKIKLMSKSQNIWDKHYQEMAKKTAMRRLYKEVPALSESVNIKDVVASEDENHYNVTEKENERLPAQDHSNTDVSNNNVHVDTSDYKAIVEDLEDIVI